MRKLIPVLPGGQPIISDVFMEKIAEKGLKMDVECDVKETADDFHLKCTVEVKPIKEKEKKEG